MIEKMMVSVLIDKQTTLRDFLRIFGDDELRFKRVGHTGDPMTMDLAIRADDSVELTLSVPRENPPEELAAAARAVVDAWEANKPETSDSERMQRLAAALKGPKPPCTCGRPEQGMTCRCTCSECYSQNLAWVPWGSYLDKDLNCRDCGHTQDIWNC